MVCGRCILLSLSHALLLSAMALKLGPLATRITHPSSDELTAGFPLLLSPSFPQREDWADRTIRNLLHGKMRWTLQDLDHRYCHHTPTP